MSKHRRGPWSQHEDSVLLSLVQTQGAHNWVRISQMITSRSPKQCRERYHQNLKPSLNLNPITPEEGALIERMVAEMGKRWAEIARRLHGRSDNAVKNWWNGGMNRRKRMHNRRTDATARNLPMQPPRYLDQQPQPSPMDANFPYAQRMQYAMTSQQPSARLQPHPQPIVTSHSKVPIHRIQGETPLPSPSAVSNMSRNDSIDGSAPPSMISDYSHYSNYSQSPNTPAGNVELPPLSAVPSEKRAQYQQHMQQSSAPQWAYAQEMKDVPSHYYNAPFYSYPAREQWKGDRLPVLPSQREPVANTPVKEQLPSLRYVGVPEIRTDDLPSPPRDSRMALSTVMD